jgi:predicted nucleic acid-binding protein
MDTILVDTSVWINFLKKSETLATKFLENQLEQAIIATCPTIIQEVLQGVLADKEYKALKGYLDTLLLLDNDSYLLAIEAANLYRSLRKKGLTIRKPNDCLIAAYAIHNNAFVLHDDKDFVHIAEFSGLKVINP